MRETKYYDEMEDRLIVKTEYDNSEVLEANKADQHAAPELGRYKGNMVHVGRIHMGDILRLRNNGYDLLSADKDEVRRALLYIQQNEPLLLTVPGKPFAKKRMTWR